MKTPWIPILSLLSLFPDRCEEGADGSRYVTGTVHPIEIRQITINGHEVALDGSGRFAYRLAHSEPGYVKLDFGKILWLYLKPGDRLDVEIDPTKEIDSIIVEGDSLEINRYLVQDSHESARAGEYFSNNFKSIVLLDEQGYREKIDEIWLPFRVAVTFTSTRARRT